MQAITQETLHQIENAIAVQAFVQQSLSHAQSRYWRACRVHGWGSTEAAQAREAMLVCEDAAAAAWEAA